MNQFFAERTQIILSSIPVQVQAVKASLVVQDLTYTADDPGAAGNDITVTYTGGATAGAEVVSVVGTDISVQIESGVSTATQVKTAVDASGAAAALVDVTISGTAGTAQTTAAEAPLANGSDGGLTGDRVDMGAGARCVFIVGFSDSTSATTILNFQQHDAAVSGNSKVLNIDNPYYHKSDAASVFTRVIPGAATDEFDLSSIFDNHAGIAVFEVLGADLDVDGGYRYVSLSLDVNAATAAKFAFIAAVFPPSAHGPAYAQS